MAPYTAETPFSNTGMEARATRLAVIPTFFNAGNTPDDLRDLPIVYSANNKNKKIDFHLKPSEHNIVK
jgi:hypothetical protein